MQVSETVWSYFAKCQTETRPTLVEGWYYHVYMVGMQDQTADLHHSQLSHDNISTSLSRLGKRQPHLKLDLRHQAPPSIPQPKVP